MLVIRGRSNESDKLVEKYEEVFDIRAKYFIDIAEFMQVAKLKINVKTNTKGRIEYMACNDQQCLPAMNTSFSIVLN